MEDDLFLTAQIDSNRSLCISSLSCKTFEECGAEFFPSERGFFIYERDDRNPGGGISVLGKAASLEAAYRFFEIINETAPQKRAHAVTEYSP